MQNRHTRFASSSNFAEKRRSCKKRLPENKNGSGNSNSNQKSGKSTLWTNAGQDQNFQRTLSAIGPYLFLGKFIWTNGPESSSKVSPYTGIGPWMVGHTPSTAGTFRKKFRKNSGKTPETLSERFLEFPSRVRLGCPKPYNSRHLKAPEHFQNSLPPSTAGGRLFFQKWFRRGPLRAGHAVPSSTGGKPLRWLFPVRSSGPHN